MNINNNSITPSFPHPLDNKVTLSSAWEKNTSGELEQLRITINNDGNIQTQIFTRSANVWMPSKKPVLVPALTTKLDTEKLSFLFSNKLGTNFVSYEKNKIQQIIDRAKSIQNIYKELTNHFNNLKTRDVVKGKLPKRIKGKYEFDPQHNVKADKSSPHQAQMHSRSEVVKRVSKPPALKIYTIEEEVLLPKQFKTTKDKETTILSNWIKGKGGNYRQWRIIVGADGSLIKQMVSRGWFTNFLAKHFDLFKNSGINLISTDRFKVNGTKFNQLFQKKLGTNFVSYEKEIIGRLVQKSKTLNQFNELFEAHVADLKHDEKMLTKDPNEAKQAGKKVVRFDLTRNQEYHHDELQ